MHILFNIFRWLLGLVFCLAAFGGFMNGDTGLALFILALGLMLLPPVAKAVFKIFNYRNPVPSKTLYAQDAITLGKKSIEKSPNDESLKKGGVSIKSEIKTFNSLNNSNVSGNPEDSIKSTQEPINEKQLQLQNLFNDLDIVVEAVTSKDDSIIDVTGNDYKINKPLQNIPKPEQERRVPYWALQYVYYYSQINSATAEQFNFYLHFKEAFLNGTYLNLEGNTNYAFILLFDLLDNDYEQHQDLVRLENQLNELGFYYPKTSSYATSFLIKKMESVGDYAGVARLRSNAHYGTDRINYDYDYWRLGNKYRKNLNLTDKETAWLNKIGDSGNNFCSIESCLLAVIKLYLATLQEMENRFKQEGTTPEDPFITVSDIIARKYFRYRKNSANYNYSVESTTNELYTLIFKHCENAVREHYGHKRKISTDFTYSINPEVAAAVEDKIVSRLKSIHLDLLGAINPPDASTEMELNIRNTSRWKTRFEEITAAYKEGEGKQFIKDIQTLGMLNQKNPALENIYFEASKFITKSDSEAALVLYLHYLYHDLQSVTFNNKQLAKTLQKSLFKTDEQLQSFQLIVADLIKDKDLQKAVGAVTGIFAPKRKRIQLDTQAIKAVQQQHSNTVVLLNGFLQDEEEPIGADPKQVPAPAQEVEISFQNMVPSQNAADDFFIDGLLLDGSQRNLLRLFFNNDFSVPKREVENFSKANGLMRNQLIDSINDCCQEQLDDVLIEEDDEHYTIYDNYFQKLIKND